MTKTTILFLLLLNFIFMGCARIEKKVSYGSKHKITQYSGGEIVNSWVSKGKVLSEESSDGYYFVTASGKYIEVSGTIVIERLSK